MPSSPIEVAAIYFPSWHDEPRRNAGRSPGWSEWDLIRAGRPRFPGHYQPIVPAWGHADETDPSVMRRSCQQAHRAGITAFLWDWYWYDEQDFLNRPLNETYLGLENPEVKFALMWANHDWVDVFPGRVGRTAPTIWPAAVDERQFRDLTTIIIERYFTSPHYWRPDGRAWFTVFQPATLMQGLGGYEQTRTALRQFRERAESAGVGDLHLNSMGGLAGLSPQQMAELGFDSVGPYNWLSLMPKDQGLEVDYHSWRLAAERQWREDNARLQPALEYIPNLTMGWDSSTRVHQDDELVISDWPFLPVVTGNTPEEFAAAAASLVQFIEDRGTTRIITVNAWNEWTEGSYLEPDERYGTRYLEALRDALR